MGVSSQNVSFWLGVGRVGERRAKPSKLVLPHRMQFFRGSVADTDMIIPQEHSKTGIALLHWLQVSWNGRLRLPGLRSNYTRDIVAATKWHRTGVIPWPSGKRWGVTLRRETGRAAHDRR
jgi:hypothetical protein